MNHFGVIMAGGSGTRFWPLSRKKKPKQLLNLSGKDLMINEAIERLSLVVGKDHIMVVTNAEQTPSVISATENKVFPQNILSEPASRNTSACIGYAAIEIVKRYGDGIMVITPSDHYIEDSGSFANVLRLAIETAEKEDKLVTVGIKPRFPATGFGYIKYRNSTDNLVKTVLEFKEKPDKETAESYLATGDYLWNSGIFVWKASLILRKLEEYAPDIFSDIMKIGEAVGTPSEGATLHEIYPSIRKISIDYSVMEPSADNGNVLVIPGDFGWDDVGSWDMLDVLHERDEKGNVFLGDVVGINVENSVVYSSGRNITLIGVENLVVVETGDSVLVCSKEKAQDVRKAVDLLSAKGRVDLL